MSEEEGMTQLQGLLGRMWRPEKRLHPYSCVFWPGTRASATKRDFRNVAKCQVARGRASKRSSIGNLLFPRPLRTGLDGKEPQDSVSSKGPPFHRISSLCIRVGGYS